MQASNQEKSQLTEKLKANGCHGMHQLAQYFLQAEIVMIKAREGVLYVYISGIKEAIALTGEQCKKVNGMFASNYVLQKEAFWAIAKEIASYEHGCGQCAIEYWENYCKLLNPLIGQAVSKKQ